MQEIWYRTWIRRILLLIDIQIESSRRRALCNSSKLYSCRSRSSPSRKLLVNSIRSTRFTVAFLSEQTRAGTQLAVSTSITSCFSQQPDQRKLRLSKQQLQIRVAFSIVVDQKRFPRQKSLDYSLSRGNLLVRHQNRVYGLCKGVTKGKQNHEGGNSSNPLE